jgi:hypothetical protein
VFRAHVLSQFLTETWGTRTPQSNKWCHRLLRMILMLIVKLRWDKRKYCTANAMVEYGKPTTLSNVICSTTCSEHKHYYNINIRGGYEEARDPRVPVRSSSLSGYRA